MILPDVNVLVYAHRSGTPDHDAFREWWEHAVNTNAPFGVSELVLAGFVRVVTHPRVFDPPTGLPKALAQTQAILDLENAVVIRPGPRHWAIFAGLCRGANAKGNLTADAYHAALAIESGSTWITTDGDYARFTNLDSRPPLSQSA